MLAPMHRAGCLTVVLLCLSGCGSAGQPAPYDATGVDGLEIPTASPDPADFVEEVDNPWLPLAGRDSWRYVVEQGGEQVGAVRVAVTGPADVAGLQATGVRTTTRVRGAGRSESTSYYAQDEAGNVWLVGQDLVDGGWRAGEGYDAGLAMPAQPRLGDAWVRVDAAPTSETVRVVDGIAAEDPEQVTLESVETGTRTTYTAGTGPVLTLEDTGRTTELVD